MGTYLLMSALENAPGQNGQQQTLQGSCEKSKLWNIEECNICMAQPPFRLPVPPGLSEQDYWWKVMSVN